MHKGKLGDKLWQFIALMRKGKLSDKPPWKFIALIILEVCVFGLAYWIVARFFPANEDIYNAIVILFIFAVGITIILRGNATRNRNLNTLGFLVFLVAVFVIIYRYEEFAVKISAFAVLLVAFAAFASIQENRRIRQDSVERESRDRKERLVDEVAKWLRELEGHIFYMPHAITSETEDLIRRIRRSPKIPLRTWLILEDAERALGEMSKLREGIKEAEYYQKMTSKLNEDLSSLIEVIANNLKERRELHVEGAGYEPAYEREGEKSRLIRELIENDRPLEGLGLSEWDIISVRFGRNAGAIRESIIKALDKAIELKASFIQVS